MKYRTFGKDGRKVSVLGFGCMRLPTTDGKPDGPVDEKEAQRIVRYGIDAGINYVDTAKVYQNGRAEGIVGRILRDGYRDKVLLATKLPVWEIRTRRDAERMFDEQRRDLGTEKIDVYLLHNLQRSYRNTLADNHLVDWVLEKKDKGEIDYAGFSFHDDADFFAEIVDSCDRWDFAQIQYNYVCERVQAGTRGLRYATGKGLSAVVMEPLLGGCLARPAGKMAELFETEKSFDPVDLALRWLWRQQEISVVLSGMSSFEQVEQNIRVASRSDYDSLSTEEDAFIRKLQDAYDASMPIKCTKCRYCVPCPAGVDIPLNFEMYNNQRVMAEIDPANILNKLLYMTTAETQQAGHCVRCGQCEAACPQKLPIRELLSEVHAALKS